MVQFAFEKRPEHKDIDFVGSPPMGMPLVADRPIQAGNEVTLRLGSLFVSVQVAEAQDEKTLTGQVLAFDSEDGEPLYTSGIPGLGLGINVNFNRNAVFECRF